MKLEQTTEQKEQTQEEMKQELDKVNQDQIENPPIERKEKVTEQLLVEGFGEEQNTLMAKIEYRGEKLEEAVWKEGDKVNICTGMAIDDTYEKQLLSKEQIEQMNLF